MNKEDILIACALEQETVDQLEDWNVLYTGVGKINATYKLTELFGTFHSKPSVRREYSSIINYGTAGSRKLPIGELVDCTKFIQRDMDVTGIGFHRGQTPFENNIPIRLDFDFVEFNPIGRKAMCGSGDNFVGDGNNWMWHKNLVPMGYDVVDMEAYALAKVCYYYKVPFISFKYITDNANEHSARDWKDNCSDGIELFKEKVISKL